MSGSRSAANPQKLLDYSSTGAEMLSADVQAAIDDDGISTAEMQELLDRAERGQYDPAFAVTFVNEMGVDGLVAIPGLLEQAQPRAGRGNYPADRTWPVRHLAPFAMLLTTAMDTRANQPADLRLGDNFVSDFVAYDGDGDQLYDYSLLVREAELPADVLKRVGNHHLGDMLTGEATTNQELHTGLSILTAIGANEQASFDWLRSDDIGGDGGSTNMQLLLEYRPELEGFSRRWRPPEALGDTIATVVDNGLQHPDRERAGELFETAVMTVGEDGGIHFDDLREPLLRGTERHMGVNPGGFRDC